MRQFLNTSCMKMNPMLVFFSMLLMAQNVYGQSFLSKFHQNDFKLKNIRSEVISYNENVTNLFKFRTFKYNRTTTALNFTFSFKQDMENHAEVVVQAYKFLSNEYRIFPLRFQVNVCKAFRANIVGLKEVLSCGNVTECSIILANVTYHICNFVVDETRLPPHLPNGMFMIELKILRITAPVANFNIYAEIYRPIPIPKN